MPLKKFNIFKFIMILNKQNSKILNRSQDATRSTPILRDFL